MTALLKSTLRRSLKATPTVEVRDTVAAALDGIMATQAAAAKAMAEDDDAEGQWRHELDEAQARAESHYEEFDWERALGREEGGE